jgi:hypothetical protein
MDLFPGMPCEGQTPEQIKEWIETKAKPGDVAVVRTSQGGMLQYRLREIESINEPTKGRVYLKGMDSFYLDGRNCYHPKGQTYMILATPAVIDAAEKGQIWHHGHPSMAMKPSAEEAALVKRARTQ